LILVGLYFLGNLAGVPLLRKTQMTVEPVWFWAVVTLVSAIVIALTMLMANRVGLGAPLIAGELSKEDLRPWLRSGLALTLLVIIISTPFSLHANLGVDPATYPFGWELMTSSFKAGVVEEIVSRFFLVSLFVWIGRFVSRDEAGRPKQVVYWVSILLSALIFGWAHVDARLGHPTATFWDYAVILGLNSGLGFYFGWLFWRLGLEWAIMAHFAYDVFVSMVLVPVYLLGNSFAWISLIFVLCLACLYAWRILTPPPTT
jgi:hypothetical protein